MTTRHLFQLSALIVILPSLCGCKLPPQTGVTSSPGIGSAPAQALKCGTTGGYDDVIISDGSQLGGSITAHNETTGGNSVRVSFNAYESKAAIALDIVQACGQVGGKCIVHGQGFSACKVPTVKIDMVGTADHITANW